MVAVPLLFAFTWLGFNFSYSTSESENWLNAGTLAHYLNIHGIKSLSIPISVNIILLGFEGDGSESINLSGEDLKPWFEHLEHSLKHVVVPVGEDQTTTNEYITQDIPIDYTLLLNVVKLCPLVSTIIEDTIYWSLRPEHPEETMSDNSHSDIDSNKYYVNSDQFESILLDLVSYLNISDVYTLFIINPHHPLESNKDKYGYRNGLSESELTLLYQDKRISNFKKDIKNNIKSTKETSSSSSTSTKPTGSTTTKANKHHSNEGEDKIIYKEMIEESEQWALLYLEQQRSKDNANQVKYAESSVYDLAKNMYENGNPSEKQYLNDILNTVSHENCLVDTWMSKNRFAWIDLSAGPFEWGPAIAGEGVRNKHSLPKIPPRIKLLQEKNQTINEKGVNPSSEDRYKEYLFETTLVQSYYDQYCTQQYQSPKLCNDLLNRLNRLRNPSSQELSSKPILSGGEDEGLHGSLLVDNTLSSLSSVVASSIRHLFLPASPLFRTPYAERITFHFFCISSSDVQDKEEEEALFPYAEYMHQIRKLKLPNQEFVFAKKRIAMSQDTDLLNAFTKSLRTANIPKLSLDGQFSTYSQIYLDSKEIQYYLKILSTDSYEHDVEGDAFMSRHIPIFLFSVGYDSTPLLIDKYYQAKAMSDMVLIVQSNIESWESRLFCNNNPIYWNLRHPLKSALSATSLLLSGLVPSHISYTDATHRAYQNWMWSIGDSPLSYTSSQYTFSETHRDISFRNYVVTTLSDSLGIVNEAAAILANLKTTTENERAIPLIPLRNISSVYADIKTLWIEIIQATSHSSYSVATKRLKALMNSSQELRSLVNQVSETLDLLKCIPNKKESFVSSNMEWLLPVCVVIDLIFFFVFLLFRRRKHKIKIN